MIELLQTSAVDLRLADKSQSNVHDCCGNPLSITLPINVTYLISFDDFDTAIIV